MRFWITYRDDTRELFETYSPNDLYIKILQLVYRFDENGYFAHCKLSALIIAHLLFEGKGQYPHEDESPLFIIVGEKP